MGAGQGICRHHRMQLVQHHQVFLQREHQHLPQPCVYRLAPGQPLGCLFPCLPPRPSSLALTMFQEGSAESAPRYSTYEAKPSFSHRSFHHRSVTKLPNHCRGHSTPSATSHQSGEWARGAAGTWCASSWAMTVTTRSLLPMEEYAASKSSEFSR